jgi:hypothetical protein
MEDKTIDPVGRTSRFCENGRKMQRLGGGVRCGSIVKYGRKCGFDFIVSRFTEETCIQKTGRLGATFSEVELRKERRQRPSLGAKNR